MDKLKKDECGAYFASLEEAQHHLRCAFSDILGYYTYQGLKGMDLITAATSLAKKECEDVIHSLLK